MKNTERYLFEKRLVSNELVFINAKKLGAEMETIGEYPSRVEANEALPDLKKVLPDCIVFISKVPTSGWMAEATRVES